MSGSDRESDASPRAAGLRERLRRWRLDRIASPGFQRWATRHWLTRGRARRDAERLWDLVSGFVASQVLLACAELNVFETLRQEPQSADALALRHGIASARMATLCRAGAALGLLTRRKDGVYDLGDLGAAALGVPGLLEMIRHNAVVYRDLTDPVALLRGETAPELARFWSYVHGGDVDPDSARTYSRLMAASQALVAEETLDSLDLSNVRHLADLGGGTGRFLAHVADRHPDLALTLMDLPGVIESARPLLDEAGLGARIVCHPGNFLDEPLPRQADAISLVRVLYDHDDDVVDRLLARVREGLPPGGLVIVSEPMSGGDAPSRIGDAYFGFYTMAMTSGRPRSPTRHVELLTRAGFVRAKPAAMRRPFLTGVVTAWKSA